MKNRLHVYLQYLIKRLSFNKILLALIFIPLSTSLYSQTTTKHSSNMHAIELLHKQYMQIHDEYIKKSNPLFYYKNQNNENLRDDDIAFFIDTATVQSVSSAPKKYTYTYSDKGYRLTSLEETEVDGEWENSTLNECTYDDAGNMLTSVWKFWDGDNWVNSSKSTNSYSVDNNLLSSINEVWDDGVWKYDAQESFSYNVGGQVVSHVLQIWSSGDWVNQSKEIYVYDDSGNMLTALGELWLSGAWRNDQQYTYTYDDYNNMLTGLYEQWQDGIWVNITRQTNTYNTANKRTSSLNEQWEDSVWVNQMNINYTYNDLDYLETSISEIWQNNSWVNTEKQEFTYGAYGGLETSILESWDGTDWVFYSMTQYVYDENGNALTGNYFVWEGGSWTQNQEGVLDLYYNYCTENEPYFGFSVNAHYVSLIVGVNNYREHFSDVICYPNPTYGISNVKFNLAKTSLVKLTLTDINGRTLKNIYNGQMKGGAKNLQVLSSELPKGTYFLKLLVNNTVKTMILVNL